MVSHFVKSGLFRRVSMSKVITFNVVTCWSTVDFVPNYGAHSTGLLTGSAFLSGFRGW